jgi:hypothetical protein
MGRIFAWPSGVACAALLALAPVLGGCEGHSRGGSRGSSFPTEAVATVAVAAAAGIAGAMSNPTSSSGTDPDLPDYLQPPPAPPPLGASDTEHLAFDPVPVLEAIDRLDLSPCIAYGALIGWGRARLTFEPNGVVSNVVVESSAGLSDTAVECLGKELSAVSASRFEGAAITIGASYFVR